jgi:hypothetical protein
MMIVAASLLEYSCIIITVEARVQFQKSLCVFMVGKIYLCAGFSQRTFVLIPSDHPTHSLYSSITIIKILITSGLYSRLIQSCTNKGVNLTPNLSCDK